MMISNPVIDTIMAHRSVRKYTDRMPDDETIKTIVTAGQRAPFAYQMCSVLLKRGPKGVPFKAPLYFFICVDVHKFELMMAKRNWKRETNDLTTFLFGIEDASYVAQNMVIAARSLGLGSCFIGAPMMDPERIAKMFDLPPKVYPIVGLTMGYPQEEDPVRPRFPLEFTFFDGTYPKHSDEDVQRAMKVMDEGYLSQEYYKRINYMVNLPEGREETFTFDDYSWTEHISRKMGVWLGDTKEQIESLRSRGFHIEG